jgi:hypothetical protein
MGKVEHAFAYEAAFIDVVYYFLAFLLALFCMPVLMLWGWVQERRRGDL